jgi:TPR repeat protein
MMAVGGNPVIAPRVPLLAGLLLLGSGFSVAAGPAGSGFFVTPDGYFVTSRQVAAEAEPVLLRDRDGGTFAARIVAVDPAADLALLKAEGVFPAIALAPSAALEVGDRVFMVKSGGAEAGGPGAALVEGVVGAMGGGAGAPGALRVSIFPGPGEYGSPLLTAGGQAIAVLAVEREAGAGAYAVSSERLMALIATEQPALAQLLSPGGSGEETRDPARAIFGVYSGRPDAPASAPDQGELVAAEMFRIGDRARLARDYGAARRWLAEAALRGHAEAQTALAGLYRSGQGGARDDAEALRWYREAAVRGDAEAMAQLGLMHAAGKGVPRDDEAALGWIRRAAELGNSSGQNALGVMYRDGNGVYRDDAAAAGWFRRAALQGDAAAADNLGVMFRDGRGVEQDPAEAAWWFRRAAEQGHPGAQFHLGLMYREGRGVPRDEAAAAGWFRRAAGLGHAAAREHLEPREKN